MRLVLSVTIFIALCSPSVATAYKPADPRPYKMTTANEKFVFVMYCTFDGWKEYYREMVAEYPTAGIYKNDGSKQLLWNVDFYSYQWDLDLASDGVHLVRVGQLFGTSEKALQCEGVSFRANGKLLRSYSIAELIKSPEELTKRSGFISIGGPTAWLEKKKLDEETLQYSIITRDGQQIVFDLKTGDIISRTRAARRWLNPGQYYVVLSCGAAIVAVVACWWFTSRRRPTASLICL